MQKSSEKPRPSAEELKARSENKAQKENNDLQYGNFKEILSKVANRESLRGAIITMLSILNAGDPTKSVPDISKLPSERISSLVLELCGESINRDYIAYVYSGTRGEMAISFIDVLLRASQLK